VLLNVGLFLLGLLALFLGAEWLVRGAARLARSFGVSALVVGLTVVAFGTSAPELVVSSVAAARGQTDVAVGNVVGSNIANIALILGLAALVTPLRVQMRLITREMQFMLVASVLLPLLALDGTVSHRDAAMLLVGFGGYLLFVMRTAPSEPATANADYQDFEAARGLAPSRMDRARDLALVTIGLGLLLLGAHLLVESAVFFARRAGISELAIGLTVVAVGTSVPELATSLIAAYRKQADIAVGNVVGSNIFNILAILGVAGLVRPLPLASSMFGFDLPVMIGLAIVLPVLSRTGMRIGRVEGGLLLLAYIAFTVALLVRARVGAAVVGT
jgi:cation:H+ antiporter